MVYNGDFELDEIQIQPAYTDLRRAFHQAYKVYTNYYVESLGFNDKRKYSKSFNLKSANKWKKLK